MIRRDLMKVGVVGATVLLAALASGCGEDESGDGLASVRGGDTTTTGVADSDGTARDPGDDGSDTSPASGPGGVGDQDGADGDGADGDGADGDGADGDGGGTPTTGDGGTIPDTGDDGPLPGEFFDIGPAAGEPMDVVGVRHDDVLNFRRRPDPGSPIVAAVAPLADLPDIRSAGEGRLLARGAWWKVTVGGEEAWANMSFLGALGSTDDITAELTGQLGFTEADSLTALVQEIVAVRGSEEPRSTVTSAVAATATGVTFDLLGLGDDALRGERLTIRVAPAGSGVELVSAGRTLICSRGVSSRGLCL